MGYLGAGFAITGHATNGLHAAREVFLWPELTTPIGLQIELYSPNGFYVASVSNLQGQSEIIDFKVTYERYGGVKSFQFSIPRDIEIPYYPLLQCRMYYNGVFWFTGEITDLPDQEKRNDLFDYVGKGLFSYASKIKINELYTSTTLLAVLQDLAQLLENESPIFYNPALIECPAINITKLEFNNKDLKKCFERCLEIANNDYTTEQYEFGVNEDQHFYFLQISSNTVATWFEGKDYQEPDVKTVDDKLVNKIDIFRTIEDSDEAEYVFTIQDTASQEKYGLYYKKVTIEDYVDSTTAENICTAIIERYKDPFKSIEIDDLQTEDKLDIGFYKLFNRPNEYRIDIDDCSDLTLWDTTHITNTTITESTDVSLTGRKSFKVVTTTGSLNEYIEFTLTNPIIFPYKFVFYINQNTIGELIKITLYNEDGTNFQFYKTLYVIDDNGDYVVDDEGNYVITQDIPVTYIDLPNDFVRIEFNISEMLDLNKIRITMNTDDSTIFYLDSFFSIIDNYYSNEIVLDKIDYEMSNGILFAKCVFNEETDNILSNIKELGEGQSDIISIFEKS